jgi:hypothetical protein
MYVPDFETFLRSQMQADRLRMSPEEFNLRMKDLYRTRSERLKTLRVEARRATWIRLCILIPLAAAFLIGAWNAYSLLAHPFPGTPSGRSILWSLLAIVAFAYIFTLTLEWSIKWRGATRDEENSLAVIRRVYPAAATQDIPAPEVSHP